MENRWGWWLGVGVGMGKWKMENREGMKEAAKF